MGVYAWNLIKQDKNFNIIIYRRGLTVLIISLLVSFMLTLLIFRAYLHIPPRDYYATSGITSPVQLTAMLAPNMSSVPLLQTNSERQHTEQKEIPQ